MHWYSARVGDHVSMRVVMDGIKDEIRRARIAGRLTPGAQIYVVTEVDAVRFHVNEDALHLCPSLQRIAVLSDRPPHRAERINPLIDQDGDGYVPAPVTTPVSGGE